MTIRRLEELISLAKKNDPLTLIAVGANDLHTITSVKEAIEENLIKAVLVGNETEIISLCHKKNINPEIFRIIHEPDIEKGAMLAVEKIKQGEADILMKGLVTTDQLMKVILDKENGLVDPGKLVTHITVIENRNYHKLLIVSDVAVIPQPSLNQKIVILNYLIKAAHALQIEHPKIAVIAPTEKIIPSIVSTRDALQLSDMNRKGEIKGGIVIGPLALDAALNAEAANIKGINNPVAGDADCLLFPNIDAGNVFYKTNTLLAKSETAALVVGAKVPVVLSSRGDSVKTKLYSIALAVLMKQTLFNT